MFTRAFLEPNESTLLPYFLKIRLNVILHLFLVSASNVSTEVLHSSYFWRVLCVLPIASQESVNEFSQILKILIT